MTNSGDEPRNTLYYLKFPKSYKIDPKSSSEVLEFIFMNTFVLSVLEPQHSSTRMVLEPKYKNLFTCSTKFLTVWKLNICYRTTFAGEMFQALLNECKHFYLEKISINASVDV